MNLQKYEFYGNVRELYNVLKRLAILIQKKGEYSVRDLIDLTYDEKEKILIEEAGRRKKGEIEDILTMLNKKNWDKGEAARELGISRTTLWRKMKIYGIE
jgi:transcriptional regulator of acetoin/glycerol metabolism